MTISNSNPPVASEIFRSIYRIVKIIPKGRVVTYGAIAKRLKTSPRMVGMALHNNPDPKRIPCHRVVDRNGKLAENFAFGGAEEQRKRLLAERVPFKSTMYVDLEKSQWNGSI